MAVSALSPATAVRPLVARDLDPVVAIDAAITGRSRRAYFERRLRAAQAQPDLHVQFGIDDGPVLAGFVLARRLLGEFGRAEAALRLEVIGVRRDERGHGLGLQLVDALAAAGRGVGAAAIRTSASWREHSILRFLDRAGFELGGGQILDCAVHAGRLGVEHEAAVEAPPAAGASGEIDYGAAAPNHFEPLARDCCDVRVLAREDLDALVRVDRRVGGRERREYIERLVAEALGDSAVRVSLVARIDGVVAGFVMARTDFGDFGRTEPVAVLDTVGVDPDYAHRHVGTALLSQLFVNLDALCVERVETVVDRADFGLLGFLYKVGFGTSQRLALVKHI